MTEKHVVTGAFGYSGRYIAQRLINENHQVVTLTNSLNRPNPFGNKVKAYSYNFDKPEELVKSLQNTSVLYNTYWVRFNHVDFKHSTAVENTLRLFDAAKKAGVKRIVHTSITNPSEDSPLEYFSGKAQLEKALIDSGIPYSILRPAVLFGKEDILINNIAWMLRKFPVFGVFGDGQYRLQPIYVDDFAQLAVQEGKEKGNKIVDAIGPETFTYLDLVKTIGRIISKERIVVSISDITGYACGWFMGKFLGDKVITRDEIKGLKSDLLYTKSLPAGKTKLTEWAKNNASTLGIDYSSELARRKNRLKSYRDD